MPQNQQHDHFLSSLLFRSQMRVNAQPFSRDYLATIRTDAERRRGTREP